MAVDLLELVRIGGIVVLTASRDLAKLDVDQLDGRDAVRLQVLVGLDLLLVERRGRRILHDRRVIAAKRLSLLLVTFLDDLLDRLLLGIGRELSPRRGA